MGEPERFAPEMPGDRSLLVDDDADEIVTADDGIDAGDDEEAGDE